MCINISLYWTVFLLAKRAELLPSGPPMSCLNKILSFLFCSVQFHLSKPAISSPIRERNCSQNRQRVTFTTPWISCQKKYIKQIFNWSQCVSNSLWLDCLLMVEGFCNQYEWNWNINVMTLLFYLYCTDLNREGVMLLETDLLLKH